MARIDFILLSDPGPEVSCLARRLACLLTMLARYPFSCAQKNLKKNGGKHAPGFGGKLSRYFAFCVPRARRMEEECSDGSVSRAEAFVELFSHVIFHFQGTLVLVDYVILFWFRCFVVVLQPE